MSARRHVSPLTPLLHWGRLSGRVSRRAFWPLALLCVGLIVFGFILRGLLAAVLGAILIWPVLASAVRRLHDTDRRGWWLLMLPVPLLGLVPLAFLLAPQELRRLRFPTIDDTPWPRVIFGTLAVLLTVTLLGLNLSVVTVRGMKPVAVPGDVVITQRSAYGWPSAACHPFRCPWGVGRLPQRGDLVLYRVGAGQTAIGRVIAMPGEQVTVRDGVPQINGAALSNTPRAARYSEVFGPQGASGILPRCINGAVGLGARCDKLIRDEMTAQGRRYPVLSLGQHTTEIEGPFAVPPAHVFVLGDNRDAAIDSRVPRAAGGPGPVPVEAIVGRPLFVAWSTRGAWWRFDTLRPGRLFVGLR